MLQRVNTNGIHTIEVADGQLLRYSQTGRSSWEVSYTMVLPTILLLCAISAAARWIPTLEREVRWSHL